MATLPQPTIHSTFGKFNRTNQNIYSGRIKKGINSEYGTCKINKWEPFNQYQIIKQIQILPKNKFNINRRIRNQKIIHNPHNKNQQIVLMQSSIFPAIYFKKTTLRNVLKQFSFPDNCAQLATDDPRTVLLYQIISNLFNEVNFYIFNILTCLNIENNSYYIFFSDCETLPFTKCCNAPTFIELQENGSGKILCNSLNCKHSNLAQFLINFEDGHKLWPNISYFVEASIKDKQLKKKISKLIINGKYKKKNLVSMVQNTSKQIVDLFYQSKQNKQKTINQFNYPLEHEQHDHDHQFVTKPDISSQLEIINANNKQSNVEDPQEQLVTELLIQNDRNIDTLKMKLKYVTKKQSDINKKISQSIVEESKIFYHYFDIMKKIDEEIIKNKKLKPSPKITFPQLMNQIQRRQRFRKYSFHTNQY